MDESIQENSRTKQMFKEGQCTPFSYQYPRNPSPPRVDDIHELAKQLDIPENVLSNQEIENNKKSYDEIETDMNDPNELVTLWKDVLQSHINTMTKDSNYQAAVQTFPANSNQGSPS